MDVNFTYYKELPLLNEKIFSADLSLNNKIVKHNYAIAQK